MGENTKADQLRAKLAATSTPMLVATYRHSAKAFEASPQAEDSNAHIVLLGMLDMELLKRDVPCCAECSVPIGLGFHLAMLHTAGTPAGDLADALTDAVVAAAAANTDDEDDDQGWGQPDGLLGPTQAELTHADELAKVRAMANDPGILAMAGAWKDDH